MSELAAAAAAGRVQGPHARAVAALAAQRAAAACAKARCGACEACRSTQGAQRRCLANRAAAAAAGGHSGAQACSFPTCLLWHEMSRPALLLVWSAGHLCKAKEMRMRSGVQAVCRLPLLATLTAACYVMMPIDFILCQLHVSHTCVCKIGGSGLCQKQRRACILEEPVRASCSCQVTLKAWSFHAAAHAGGSDGRARGGRARLVVVAAGRGLVRRRRC